jgi:hypothetical protein
VKEALDYIVRDARTIIRFSDVFRALGMTRMDFHKTYTTTQSFQKFLGIERYAPRNSWHSLTRK